MGFESVKPLFRVKPVLAAESRRPPLNSSAPVAGSPESGLDQMKQSNTTSLESAARVRTRRRNAVTVILSAAATWVATGFVPVSAAEAVSQAAASAVRVSVTESGGFFDAEYTVTRLPVVYVQNGKLLLPGRGAELVPKVVIRSVSGADLIARTEALYDAAVEPAGGFGTIPVDGLTSTKITVTTARGTRSVTVQAFAYQPGFDYVVGAEAGRARRALYQAVSELQATPGRSSTYKPSRIELWRQNVTPGVGPVTLRITPTPSTTPGCSSVPAASIPASTPRSSSFRLPNKKVFQAFIRPVLPGETTCGRSK